MLKLYGTDEYSLDEAIDLLKEWESQYDENSQLGWESECLLLFSSLLLC